MNLDELTDAERDDVALMAAHAAGDREALGRLIARHRRQMCAVAFRLLNDVDAVDDVVGTACLAVVRNAHRWRADAPVGAWLTTITRNAALDHRRRQAGRARSATAIPLTAAMEPVDPRDDYAAAEAREQVDALLAQIPPKQAQALRALVLDGLDRRTVARHLGVEPVTVSTRVVRARASLARLTQGAAA